ncbi:MAG TPA: TIGR00730 family Rossman fold protein [Candidatus Baltobacteraceae bacterium]|nr:TIGR00730 family Rossman fold protein [Candidatus Baltobacteraceae bacterium]
MIQLPKRQAMKRRICVFCGSSPGFDAAYLRVAAGAATEIVRAGFGVVYGGGRIGLMGAVADAALAAGGEVVGVIPQALSRVEIEHSGLTALHVVGSMHERKALMASESDAFIALPGGFGTMDEFCEILSWRQLGIHDKPIGLLNQDGYYDPLLALFDAMVDRGFLTPSHRALFVDAPDVDRLLAKMLFNTG